MNIILLSGGSGKRLWPLSNDVRSKQFIKLFKDDEGNYESMVQRIYRQITTVDSNAKVTIATSKSQVSTIHNQLGDKVSVCVEPCRRDTFPAILLATVYLHELGVSVDETVIVCPVDPFVDNSYFEEIGKMERLVEDRTANLTLMGIEPTYPSEKYGYIIPELVGEISMVKAFKEKPDEKTAEEYLKQNALWNAGVFAFRLGYLLEKAQSIVDFTDYCDLYSKYKTLKKISFDYAVVEKEPSIQVIRYNGEWRDIGTWDTMADVMADDIKGSAIMDVTCENTQIINELNIPIIAMGCKSMVIAASGDGILVSDKIRSTHMKPYVDALGKDAMFAEKSWGTYAVIDVQSGAMTVKIAMEAGERMSYHSHDYRDEVWTVVAGSGKAVVDGMERELRAGDVLTVAAGCRHTVIAITCLDIIEVQIGEFISVDDKRKYSLEGF